MQPPSEAPDVADTPATLHPQMSRPAVTSSGSPDQSDLQYSEQPLTGWRLGEPIPQAEGGLFENFESYLETPPEGLEVDDVELIWWIVAACFGHEALRARLVPIVARRKHWDCFSFSPISDLEGIGRYPTGIVHLLREILPQGALIPVEREPLDGAEEPSELLGTLLIQNEIWHDLTWGALRLAPLESLPDHLRDARFSGDLGV